MARIIGGIGTTHVPAIGKAIAEGKQSDRYWSPFFRGFDYVHGWLAREKPDVAVVFSNDHGLNFFLDKLPTFAIGAANEYRNEDEGWGIPVSKSAVGDANLSWHLINQLVGDGFDMTICQEMLIDHAVTIPMALMWPGEEAWPVRIVPISINTVQHPLPSLARSLNLGRSVGRALDAYDKDIKVVVIGTGGLSHQLDGERAGFINKKFDLLCMDQLARESRRANALLDSGVHRTGRCPGHRISQLDGDARRAYRQSVRGASQLSHSDLQHRGCDDGVRKHPGRSTQEGCGREGTTCSCTMSAERTGAKEPAFARRGLRA